MNFKKGVSLLLVGALVFSLASCAKPPVSDFTSGTSGSVSVETSATMANTSGMDFGFSNRDGDDSYTGAVRIVFSDNGSTVSGVGASASGTDVSITREGTYLVSGKATDGILTVSVGKEDKVQIVLDGLELAASDSPAIYIQSGDKVFITLADGSENVISDREGYTATDGETTLDGAIFSRSDLTINGSGSLTVNGNGKHGIVSKDDLVITGGNITVTAKNVGLDGKDCVKIGGGTLTIAAGSDGIRSDNAEDADRGYVYISGGTLAITAENDAIQAETVLKIDGGDFHITTGDGSGNASTTQSGGFNPSWGFGGWGGSASSSSSTAESAKALKAVSDILITGGAFVIDSADDCIHSNGNVAISGGEFSMKSGDDGIHADASLSISAGKISIGKSYEGLESSELVIAGGTIDIVASDDGLNAAGGNDSSGMGGRPGQGMFSSSTGSILISGGYTVINASGDGIDANGNITVTGGITLVSGPTSSGNGAFDYDGTATVTGGVLMALGSSGMAMGFSSAENQGSILVSTGTQQGGSTFALCDEEGNVIVSFTPAKAYQTAAVTAPEIQNGKKYTVVIGATIEGANENGYAHNTTKSGGTTVATVEMTSLIYGSGGMGGFGGGGRPGGMGGNFRP